MARWTEELQLIKTRTDKDGDGLPVEVETARRDIFANEKSITRSEFYSAKQADVKADIVYEVLQPDYEGEMLLDCGGKRYSVIRTYKKGDDIIELVCSDISETG